MPAPSPAWALIRITGHFRDYYGAELNGTVTFTPTVISKDTTNNLIVLPTLPNPLTATVSAGILYGPDLVAGILLPATNDPDLSPVGWVYTVSENLAGAAANTYSISVPYDAAGGTLDLADIIPAVATTTFSSYALASTVTPLTAEYNRRLDFYRYGAIGDGSADDTAAVQAAFNAVVDAGNGVPAATYQAVPGTFKLTAQINIVRKALHVVGAGVGNPTAYTPNPGKGTTFQWAGASGGYPFRIVDSHHVIFQDILFQGSTSAPPGAYIRCYNDGASTVGTNAYFRFEGCTFGRFTWSNVSTAAGSVAATAGILFDGTNTNNDQFVIRDCQFDECVTPIDIPNSQSIWGQIENCFFNHATVAGIRTSANVTVINAQFNNCTIDIQINSTARVSVYGHHTENSAKMVDITTYGSYACYGGFWLFSASLGSRFIERPAFDGGTVLLSGVEVSEGAFTGKKLYLRGGNLTVIACPGITAAMLDVQAYSSGSGSRVIVKSGTLSYDTLVPISAVLATPVVSGGLSIISHEPVAGWPYGSLLTSGETNQRRELFTAQSSVTQTSGTVEFSYFICQRTELITQLTLQVANIAASTVTLIRYGLYTVAANGDLTLVASTANDATLLAGTFQRYPKALSSSYTKLQGQYYATAHIVVATSPPALYSDNAQGSSLASNEWFLLPRFMSELTGQSDLPGSVSNASLVASRRAGFMELLP